MAAFWASVLVNPTTRIWMLVAEEGALQSGESLYRIELCAPGTLTGTPSAEQTCNPADAAAVWTIGDAVVTDVYVLASGRLIQIRMGIMPRNPRRIITATALFEDSDFLDP
jgi:hypothetical protein